MGARSRRPPHKSPSSPRRRDRSPGHRCISQVRDVMHLCMRDERTMYVDLDEGLDVLVREFFFSFVCWIMKY
jgi:hypothetical protein